MKTINFLSTSPKRQTVRSMAALILCMFFFAVTGCKDEFDESEIFRTRGWIIYNEGCGWNLADPAHVLRQDPYVLLVPAFFQPRNLPRKFQAHRLQVDVVFGYRQGDRDRQCRLPEITILEIEAAIRTSRFYVRETDNLGYLLFEDFEYPGGFVKIVKPSCLPEEFRQDGLQVDVTYRMFIDGPYRYDGRPVFCIEIISIMKTPKGRAETRITGNAPS